ncbi:FAD-dependent oxidoreductase [Oceanivirga miroungae]|uniref:Thioredoxin reductase n=1 Tax=Oceanivirga miroungae TaxID=1130046 RepID=A0A6I8M8J8_9FUSO|nr:FAD-dependent oxidoreductase [Oceanivirga miroungae]VWL85845.1 thioredoxin reductase [Oceanivirga miroungae]
MENKIYDVVIIGAGPAGVSSAIYTVRKGLSVLMIADIVGGQVTTTKDIENIIGIPKTTGYDFTLSLEKHLSEYDVDKYFGHMVNKIELDGKYKIIKTDDKEFRAKSVIITSGARHKKLGVKGEGEYANKGVHYCATCDGPFYRNLDVVVVGGGNSGVEAAIDLSNIVKSITLLEISDSLKADNILQEKIANIDKIKVITNAALNEVKGEQFVTSIEYKDVKTNTLKTLNTDAVFIEIGVVPNTDSFKDLVETNNIGEIKIDKYSRTNVDGIFAAGDVTDAAFKQIVISIGDAAKAALSAFNYVLNFEDK